MCEKRIYFLFEGEIEESVPRDHRLSSRVLSRLASLLEAEVPQLRKKRYAYMGAGASKPVFGISDQIVPKPAYLDTKTSSKHDFFHLARLAIIYSRSVTSYK